MTVVNAGCLQEVGTGLKELLQGFIKKAQRNTGVLNPVVGYILHKPEAGAVTWRKVADGGAVKHFQLRSKCSTML